MGRTSKHVRTFDARGEIKVKRLSTIREVFGFLHERKKYWLGPIIVLLVVFGALIVFGEASGLGPFVYPFF